MELQRDPARQRQPPPPGDCSQRLPAHQEVFRASAQCEARIDRRIVGEGWQDLPGHR